MARVVIGGLATSTIITLFLIPIVYLGATRTMMAVRSRIRSTMESPGWKPAVEQNDTPKESIMIIENGKQVKFHYTLTVDDKVMHTSEKEGPLSYTHGSGHIIPGLAAGMEGMSEGDEKCIEVSAENAYGAVNLDAFSEVPKSSLPEGLEPQEGMILQANTSEGAAIPVRVSEVRAESVIIDMNHPLAGKDLKFDVKIVSVT